MVTNPARPLNSVSLAFRFLTGVLGIEEEEAGDISMGVMMVEKLLSSMERESTLKSKENRHPLHKTNRARAELRDKIFYELINRKRLKDDDKIKMGSGGAKPNARSNGKQSVIITGLPASGKSTIANKIADLYGAYIIDSDFAKRKFPEFKYEFGAAIVHEEATIVTFGADKQPYSEEKSLYEACIASGVNMVIPKIGSQTDGLRSMRDALIINNYEVHLVFVDLKRETSCLRAINRFKKTKRYVPLGLIFDCYGSEPKLTFHEVKDDKEWKSIGTLSTEGKKPKVSINERMGPVDKLQKKGFI